jgi:flagellin
MLSINSNVSSTRTATLLNSISQELQQSAQRVASGKRILTAADDPAGMGIVSNMKAQYSSYNAVQKNISAGKSLLEVASSSLGSQQEIMKQMKELATQAASGTLTAEQRTALNDTFSQLKTQLDESVNNATIFGQNLTGTAGANVVIQSGINAGNTFTITAAKSDTTTLALNDLDLTDTTKATAAMTAIDTAVGTVASNQSVIGAQQNGLDKLAENAKTVQNNLESSISRIEDVDMAAETAKLQQLQAKMQLTAAMMSITNQMPSYILQLLR